MPPANENSVFRGLGRPPAVVVACALAAVVLVVANVATFVLTRVTDLPPLSLFRLSDERNVPTWFSSIQLFGVAVVTAVFALHVVRRRDWRTWGAWLLPAFFAFLSLDEYVQMHEYAGKYIARGILGLNMRTGLWVAVCLPPFLLAIGVLVLGCWRFLRGRRRALMLYGAGLALFLLCAVGLELAANALHPGSGLLHVEVIIEEAGEMWAATLMLWASLELLRSHGIVIGADLPSAGQLAGGHDVA